MHKFTLFSSRIHHFLHAPSYAFTACIHKSLTLPTNQIPFFVPVYSLASLPLILVLFVSLIIGYNLCMILFSLPIVFWFGLIRWDIHFYIHFLIVIVVNILVFVCVMILYTAVFIFMRFFLYFFLIQDFGDHWWSHFYKRLIKKCAFLQNLLIF